MPPPGLKTFFEMLFYQHPPFFVCIVKKNGAVVVCFDYILVAGILEVGKANPAWGRDWKGGRARCVAMERTGAEP